MERWLKAFRYDPLGYLRTSDNRAIEFFCRRDLYGDVGNTNSPGVLWDMPEALRLIRKQHENGSWRYPAAGRSPVQNYSLLETFRNLVILVEKYGLNKNHPSIQRAAEYLFGCQTGEGDFRGILGNQYSTYYSGAIMELLIKAGYGDHPNIERGFRWLLSVRQEDGGWALPLRTAGENLDRKILESPSIAPNASKPFSHLITGMVLRAFAAHPRYRSAKEALHAGMLLKGRFFKPDRYTDRRGAEYWVKFSYPFWWTDLLSSLDSLSLMNFPHDDGEIRAALDWFVKSQNSNGSWDLALIRAKDKDLSYWVTLAICRVFKRFLS